MQPGSPVAKTLGFHRSGHSFNPWSENLDPIFQAAKNKQTNKKTALAF